MSKPHDRRPRILLACLLVMVLVLAWVLLSPEPTTGHGVAHPQFSAMKVGADPDRHRGLLVPGLCYGVAQLIFFGVLLTWGVKPSAQPAGTRWLSVVTLLTVATFVLVVTMYGASLLHGSPRLSPLWGLPWSTALSVFGMWLVPLLFAVLFVWKFPQWVYDERDAARFEEARQRFAVSKQSSADAAGGQADG